MKILVRADSGFWYKKVCAYLSRQGCEFSIGVTMRASVQALIAQIPDPDWEPVADYPDTGVCELAETILGEHRLIVRRVHLHAQEAQGELFSYWRYNAFIINRIEAMYFVDSEHRQHAVVELVIRYLKDQALAHFPSGHYSANSAWTVIACLAHNLARCTIAARSHRPHTPYRGDYSSAPVRAPWPDHPNARQFTCTCPLAGPGRPASSKRSSASERCLLPLTHDLHRD